MEELFQYIFLILLITCSDDDDDDDNEVCFVIVGFL
jgi:hypothetical protein